MIGGQWVERKLQFAEEFCPLVEPNNFQGCKSQFCID